MPTYKKGDLYVASVIHVLRDGKNDEGKPVKQTVVIQPGQMASDAGLTAKEIESIQKRPQSKGVLRPPTYEEMQQMDAAEEKKSAAEAARAAEQEQADLAASQKFEKDQLAAKQAADAAEEQRKLEAEQAKERDAAAAKAAKEANAAGKKK